MTPDTGVVVVTGSNGRIGDAVMRRFLRGGSTASSASTARRPRRHR